MKVNKANMKAEYLSTAELAKLLKITRIAAYKKIIQGKIPSMRVGRAYQVKKEDVENYLKGNVDTGRVVRKTIQNAVHKVVQEYGTTLKLLGQE